MNQVNIVVDQVDLLPAHKAVVVLTRDLVLTWQYHNECQVRVDLVCAIGV